ncbi:MAG TPA: DUF2924 domain-containing protein [Rhizobiaceae bacterium]|nr:DUF2924 domain-containing protein [Rhizobiaceae bacterium]
MPREAMTDPKIEQKVAAIGDLSRADLIERWQKIYGSPPPMGIQKGLLERSAAWHQQASRLGGLSAAARAMLRASTKTITNSGVGGNVAGGETDEAASDKAPSRATPPLPPGTRLMREWNGRMHVVDVTEAGVLFDGKLYRSLTAVAKRITGAHWSGPRFFGL